jgi:hypothetical protein
MKRVFLVRSDSEEPAEFIEVEDGTTVEQVLAERVDLVLDNYTIRMNRETVDLSQEVGDRARITITPNKMEGN